ncbi:MAG: hypothetical protein ACJ79S_16590 [Gemmatimonadaceae bacterium]
MTTTAALRRDERAAAGASLLAVVAALVALLVLATLPSRAAGQALDRAVRFPVTSVGDSTFTFPVGELRWVKAGERGMAVDPRRRDALVARFQVLQVDRGTATALVTGQTTRLTEDHVAILEMPPRPWYANSLFWTGALLGLLGGAAIGSR